MCQLAGKETITAERRYVWIWNKEQMKQKEVNDEPNETKSDVYAGGLRSKTEILGVSMLLSFSLPFNFEQSSTPQVKLFAKLLRP